MIEEDKPNREFVATYKGKRLYYNGYSIVVTLGKLRRYFYADGKRESQVARAMKEVDDFLDGRIK